MGPSWTRRIEYTEVVLQSPKSCGRPKYSIHASVVGSSVTPQVVITTQYVIIAARCNTFTQDVINTRNVITFTQDVIKPTNAKCSHVFAKCNNPNVKCKHREM